MRIEQFQILNYASHFDSGVLRLTPGMNIVVGRNSVGKSVLLEALSLRFSRRPHRSVNSIRHSGDSENPISDVQMTASCSGQDLRRAFLRAGDQVFCPWPIARPKDEAHARELIDEIFSASQLSCSFRVTAAKEVGSNFAEIGRPAVLWAGGPANNGFDTGDVAFVPTPDRQGVGSFGFGASGKPLWYLAAETIASRVFRFQAERMVLGQCPAGMGTTLAQDAQNLPEVLSNLQVNREHFSDYERLVKEVFPHVEAVTIRPYNGNTVQIMVWQISPSTRRDDLAFPLKQCGTGIGQVLAILYVAAVSNDPQIILIDEPNSFLHPGAPRMLVRVLRRFRQHQYVIATHAPEVIAEAGDCAVVRVEWAEGASKCQSFESRTMAVSRQLLNDVGARLSDVFGFDEVMWVEAPSDQSCVVAILEVAFDPLPGLTVLPVRDTGNFDKRRAADIVAIYRQASMGSALVPPTIGFLLDRDGRTETDIEHITSETKGAVSFLDRVMIENYLLDPQAISEALNSECANSSHVTTPMEVETWMTREGKKARYDASKHLPFSELWFRNVHGGKLLKDLFANIFDQPAEFRKTTHCEQIVRAILQRDVSLLSPLIALVETRLSRKRRVLVH